MRRFTISLIIAIVVFAAYAILPPERTGNFLVTSFGSDSIAVYDSLGNYIRTFTAPGINGPRGIVFAPLYCKPVYR